MKIHCDPGVNPGKWVDRWRERYPEAPLKVEQRGGDEPLEELFASVAENRGVAANATEARSTGSSLGLIRVPLRESQRAWLHSIPLYDETAELVMPRECILAALETVRPVDLLETCRGDDGFPLLTLPGHLPAWVATHEAWFEAGVERAALQADTFADAIEAVGHGAGLLLVPQAVARTWSRKDVVRRPFEGLPHTSVSLVWPRHDESSAVADFIGVVRGRTARSSRGDAAPAQGARRAASGAGAAKTRGAGTGKAAAARNTKASGKGAGRGRQGGTARPGRTRGAR
ncbi:LysR family transcriptional regulator substrate-binding protein [Micrococcales bacterium 31B]|nr:LysR family transcriptional regulator substrate-binding protein [Micrococcales bacterium 31B]